MTTLPHNYDEDETSGAVVWIVMAVLLVLCLWMAIEMGGV
jgi:hypothetical protein